MLNATSPINAFWLAQQRLIENGPATLERRSKRRGNAALRARQSFFPRNTENGANQMSVEISSNFLASRFFISKMLREAKKNATNKMPASCANQNAFYGVYLPVLIKFGFVSRQRANFSY